MSNQILLTGATGFLGSHLAKSLLTDNHEVIILKRSFSDTSRIKEIIDKVSVYNIDKTNIEEIFKNNRIKTIIHTATEYGRNNTSVHQILEANLIFPINLVELGIKYQTECFINTDSYFNKPFYSYSNLLNYAMSKRSFLTWLNQFSPYIKVINASLEHIYGPYDSEPKLVEMLIQKVAIEQQKQVALTHGHQRRDFIFVEDVANAYRALLKYANEYEFTYEHFEIGTGQSHEVRELASIIKKISNSPTELRFGDIPYRADEIMESKADTKLMRNLGWSARVPLEEGIKKIIDQYAHKMAP